MEHGGSLPWLQEPAIGAYPEPQQQPKSGVLSPSHFVTWLLWWEIVSPWTHLIWTTKVCRLSETVNPINSQLPSICKGLLLHTQPEDMPCRNDMDSEYYTQPNTPSLLIYLYTRRIDIIFFLILLNNSTYTVWAMKWNEQIYYSRYRVTASQKNICIRREDTAMRKGALCVVPRYYKPIYYFHSPWPVWRRVRIPPP
jgi:hypothetical protein